MSEIKPQNTGTNQPEIVTPRSEEHWLELRAQDVTSTESAALFGASPYLTEFELWHRHKHGRVVEIEKTERMVWGNRLESAIAHGIAEDKGLEVAPLKDYMRLPDLRMGASFDFSVKPTGLLEIKNVDARVFQAHWEEVSGHVEAPPHIEIQVQHQLAVSGRDFALIGVLVGGNHVVVVEREPDPEAISRIKERIHEFWVSIEKGDAPSPDFIKDAGFIKELYRNARKGLVVDSTARIEELASHYKSLSENIKELEAQRDAAKAEILMLSGDAEKIKGPGFSISCGVVEGGPVSYVRKPYRNFKLTWGKS